MYGLYFIRRTDFHEDEELTGWIPLSIRISFDSGGMHVTKIDEVLLYFQLLTNCNFRL